ncbi:MAG: recombinase family protein [Armatimonadetes bacterium]|nr:recombinase family protein [Armatimonadota bacterium]
MKPHYFAYIRKSTDDTERQVMSIDSQKQEILRKWGHLFEIEFVEDKLSAFVPNNRPNFDLMLDRLSMGEKLGLLAWHPDRLSRNELDAAKVTYAVRTGKIGDLQFASYTFFNSPEGIMMLQMALSHSQYDSAKKGKDVLRQMTQKAERGWYPDMARTGYKNVWSERHHESIIIVDEERFPLLRKAVELVLSRIFTPAQVLKKLNEEWGFRTMQKRKTGGKPLSSSAWYDILNSRFYIGVFDWRGIEYKGNHKPLMTAEEFDEVRRIIGSDAKPRSKKHSFTYSGALKCRTCGFSVIFEKKSKYLKRAQEIKSYTVAHCSHKSRAIQCDDRVNLNETKLIDQIRAKISDVHIHPLLEEWAIDVIESQRKESPQQSDDAIHSMQQKSIEQTSAELKNFARMRAKGQISEELFVEESTRLEATLKQLREDQTPVGARAVNAWVEPTRKTFHFACSALANLGSDKPEDRKAVLLEFTEQAYLDHGKLIAEPREWFRPIIEFVLDHKEEIERLEPVISSSDSTKKADLEGLRLGWYSVVSQVRTIHERRVFKNITITRHPSSSTNC